MDSWKRTLLELLAGIGLSGILFEIAGVIFVKQKAAYSLGILFGILIAAGMAVHMAFSLDRALDWEEEIAKASIRKSYTLRYLTVVLVFGLLAWWGICDMIACFLGIMTLKTAAYLQPFVHKFCNKHILKIEEGGCEDGFIIDDDDEYDFGDW